MFREMRRSKQQLSEADAISILENGKTGVLAVLGDNGYPYAVPLNYVYKDGKIYIHCAKTGHKLDAVRSCDKVSFCVVAQDDVVAEKLATRYRSVIAFCRARVLETEEEIFAAVYSLGMKYNNNPERVKTEINSEMAALACIELTIEHLTGKQNKSNI